MISLILLCHHCCAVVVVLSPVSSELQYSQCFTLKLFTFEVKVTKYYIWVVVIDGILFPKMMELNYICTHLYCQVWWQHLNLGWKFQRLHNENLQNKTAFSRNHDIKIYQHHWRPPRSTRLKCILVIATIWNCSLGIPQSDVWSQLTLCIFTHPIQLVSLLITILHRKIELHLPTNGENWGVCRLTLSTEQWRLHFKLLFH